ncbi:peptidyl-prolyl isomerase cwc27 [Umbelopsis sp. PMI_123]|nr:peptidyl-prolyl isomerase cwc27 [Umbelopsis sp. PMI_123]
MSNIYIQEPHPSGKVILHTSMGDVSIELWCRETPKACRNFIQLCMEGYYDNTIFHRVVADFIVQGGDPSGTGEGGESIYGEPFADEFHTRLRFVRRGLVAMANAGKNDNGSQFFFTLDTTPELTNKHTIFGRVEGDTIFNVLKMGELEVDDNERPLYPPRIKTTEIILNPFDDIAPRISDRERLIAEAAAAQAKEPPKKKKKETKKLNLLSFGEEGAQEFEPSEEIIQQKKKNNTSQDLLEVQEDVETPNVDRKKASLSEAKEKIGRISKERSEPSHHDLEKKEADSFDQQMREKVRMSREKDTSEAVSHDPAKDRQEEIRRLQQDIKNLSHDAVEERKKEEAAKKKKQKVSFIESERAKYKRGNKAIIGGIKGRKKSQVGNDDDTFTKFQAFQSKLLSAESAEPSDKDIADQEKVCSIHGIPNCESCFDTFGEQGEADTDEGWMAHKLVFAKDLKGKDLMQRRDNLDDYLVIDPRQRQAQATAEDMDKRQKAKERRLGEAFRKRDRDDHRSERDRDHDRNHSRNRHHDSDYRRDRDRDQKRSRRDYDDRRR